MIGGAFFLAVMAALSHGIGSRCDWAIIALVRAIMMLGTSIFLVKMSGGNLVFLRPRTLWIRSLAGSFSLVCNFYAFTRLYISDAITLMNVHPLWILLISAAILRQVPSKIEVVGVICGLIGVVLVEQPHLSGSRTAAVVALLSSMSSAVAMLGLHRLRNIDARAVVAHFAGVATLVSTGCLLARWHSGVPIQFELRPSVILLLLALGISGTIGQILLTKAYAVGSPSKVATVGLTQVLFAIGFDVFLWNRQVTPMTLAGFVLVLAPTTWLSVRSARSRAHKSAESPVAEPSGRV